MTKLQIISDKNKKSSKIKNLLIKKITQNQFKKENLIIVIGGDGFMLQTLKKNKNSKKQFYGINSGNYGFLMNKFSLNNIIKNLSKANMISISPLEMIVKNKNNQIRKSIAINEVSVLRQSRQAASLSIKCGSRQIIKNLVSDGVLVSTPAGSTAYNLSVHGPILSLHSKKLSISPISAFRPRRWKGKIVNDKLKILITNLNPSKRPISAVADNLEVRNAKSITIKINHKIKFNLLYDKSRGLQKKIKIEQLRRETN
jgi:NAD+ kinase